MSDDSFRSLSSETDWADARSRSEKRPILLFKHSSACPVSAKADQEMRQLVEDHELPVYKLVVQESRALSDEIADTLSIRHETPQAIVLHQKEPVFDTSHFDVTAEALREAVRSATVSTE